MSYKVFHCSFDWRGGYGSFETKECIVVAEIESKALGMALMEYPDTSPGGWTATEIPLTEGVTHISSRSS